MKQQAPTGTNVLKVFNSAKKNYFKLKSNGNDSV